LLAALAGFFVGFAIWFHVTTKVIQTAYFQQFAIVFLTGAMFALIERIRCAKTAIVSTIGIAAITAITTSAVAILPAIAVAAILTGKAQFQFGCDRRSMSPTEFICTRFQCSN
jgi:hypothetical protein